MFNLVYEFINTNFSFNMELENLEDLIVSCETSRKRKARKMIVWYLASFFVFKLPCGFCGRFLVFLMCF